MRAGVRAVIFGLVVGVVALSSALAGIVIAPPGPLAELPTSEEVARAAGLDPSVRTSSVELQPPDVVEVVKSKVRAPKGGRTPQGTFLVGAARASLSPAPTSFGGERWQTEGCTSIDDQSLDTDHALPDIDPADPVASLDDVRGWPATGPDCIYLGGFGIGPARYAKGVGTGGVWVRALAISNGIDTFVYAIADTVGWFARYDPMICDDCGVRDVREELASDLGLDIGSVVVGSTHSHAGADTYGGWGGIPKWYRKQIRDSAVAAAKQAVSNLEPATLTVGEAQLRNRNNERRDTYYSTVDTAAPWIQARTLPTTRGCAGTTPPAERWPKPKPTPTPVCTPSTVAGSVIATMTAFAAHPTIVGEPVLHADWPGATARRFEQTQGGVGVVFEGGLGNASVSGVGGTTEELEAENTGIAIADDVSRTISHGETMASNDLASSVQDISHPVDTNLGLVTLATVGFFDREFLPVTSGPGTAGADVPGVYHWSKQGELSTADDNDPGADPGVLRGCTSAGPSLRTTVGAHRIGTMLVAFAPGEIFSNVAEVIKERADANSVAMVLGQSNDALGYIIQSFEFDTQGNAVTEYGTRTGEYEEVFSVDRCFGDHVLETALESTAALGFGG
jgi:hypothetical protein